jgi:hypothetical protein
MALQFDNSSSGAVTLKPNASGNWSFTMPSTDGTSGQFLGTNGSATAAWFTPSAPTTTGTTFTQNTSAPNNLINASNGTATAGTGNTALALVPKGTGGLLGAIPDGTAVGGDARGTYAFDLQLSRTASTMVAASNYSVILGGQNNTCAAFSDYQTICGGNTNYMIAAQASVICNGNNNTMQNANYAAIINGQRGQCGTGSGNSDYSCILNGYYNSTNSQNHTLAFPTYNNAQSFYGCTLFLNTRLGGYSASTATVALTTKGGNPGIDSTNSLRMENSSCMAFDGTVIATLGNSGNTKSWSVEGVATRNNSGNTTLLNNTVTTLYADAGASGWTLTITADTTNQCIVFTVVSATSVATTAQINQYRIKG